MARMILTLSAVFFFVCSLVVGSPLLAVSSDANFLHEDFFQSELSVLEASRVVPDYMTLESLARGISLASVCESTDTVVTMLNGVLARYPHMKFAFCVTLKGDFLVLDESMLSPAVRAPYSDRTVQPSASSAVPITAFHIASMNSETGYHELPRPIPVQAPAVVYTGVAPTRPIFDPLNPSPVVTVSAPSSPNGVVTTPEGQVVQLARPSSPWRSIFLNNDRSYVLLLGLSGTAS